MEMQHAGLQPAQPPPGTVRVERRTNVSLTGTSLNDSRLKSRSFDRLKAEMQGVLMRHFHRMSDDLPRPIPAVGPVWVHARQRFAKPALRDRGNWETLTIKATGDAFVGPKSRWVTRDGKRMLVDAERTMIYQGAAYTGGWLEDDSDKHWLSFFDLDPHLGEPCLHLTIVWDEPLQLAA